MKTIDLSKNYTLQVHSSWMSEDDREDLKIDLYHFLTWEYFISEDDEEEKEVQKLNEDFEKQVSELKKVFFKDWRKEPDDIIVTIN